MNNPNIVYEQPLTERIRNLLRLEHLFETACYTMERPSMLGSRVCLATLIDINDLMSRTDVRAELIKEMDRHIKTLIGYQQVPEVDSDRLTSTLDQLKELQGVLRGGGFDPGRVLRKDELVFSVKQRQAIAGGTCSFDLPAYHHWLNTPASERLARLKHWFQDLGPLQQGVDLVLKLVRDSATTEQAETREGFYQQDLDPNTACQLIRVTLATDCKFFPEISGGRHRATIRFLSPSPTSGRATQTNQHVRFGIQFCTI